MTSDLEKAQRIVADLEAKRGVLVGQGTDLADERANIALAAYTGDAKARARLDEIGAALATHANELAGLDAAIRTACEHVAAAQQVEARAADTKRAIRVHGMLADLEALGAKLDEGTGPMPAYGHYQTMPTAETHQPRFLRDPPTQVRTAALVRDILAELRALRLGVDVSFPAHWAWGSANREDLRSALLTTVLKYQGHFADRQRDSFVSLIGGWTKRIRADLARFGVEQTKENADAAA